MFIFLPLIGASPDSTTDFILHFIHNIFISFQLSNRSLITGSGLSLSWNLGDNSFKMLHVLFPQTVIGSERGIA
ncbi:hypothetical protein HanXRQr2_Chr08g0320841 [Helianthus annuus]|uniref:Uncharacterized protein n=1 Tax=Helianthus annuus TaxID=4232 RepID=A0A251U1T2_HELAN|nr:hypothetical protein HanXRQr2_Chr08g0320841 [Helianthus annuus]